MSRNRHSARFLALLPLALALGAGATEPPDAAARAYQSSAFHRAFEWRASTGDERAGGLYLMDMVPTGMVQRVLVEDPEGRQVRITKSLDVRRGLDTCELLDDATGWQARLELDFGFQAETLGAFFAEDEARSAEPGPVRLRFAATGVSPVEVALTAAAPDLLHAAVAEAVGSSEAGRELIASLPEGLAETILFLDSSLSPEPLDSGEEGDNVAYATRGVVEVIAGVVRTARPRDVDLGRYATTWPMTVQPIERGTSSTDPAVLEFVSRFRSVENADPLSDRPAAEAFGQEPPPT